MFKSWFEYLQLGQFIFRSDFVGYASMIIHAGYITPNAYALLMDNGHSVKLTPFTTIITPILVKSLYKI